MLYSIKWIFQWLWPGFYYLFALFWRCVILSRAIKQDACSSFPPSWLQRWWSCWSYLFRFRDALSEFVLYLKNLYLICSVGTELTKILRRQWSVIREFSFYLKKENLSVKGIHQYLFCSQIKRQIGGSQSFLMFRKYAYWLLKCFYVYFLFLHIYIYIYMCVCVCVCVCVDLSIYRYR